MCLCQMYKIYCIFLNIKSGLLRFICNDFFKYFIVFMLSHEPRAVQKWTKKCAEQRTKKSKKEKRKEKDNNVKHTY